MKSLLSVERGQWLGVWIVVLHAESLLKHSAIKHLHNGGLTGREDTCDVFFISA